MVITIQASPTPIGLTTLNDDVASSSGPLAQLTGAPESAQNFAKMVKLGIDLFRVGDPSVKVLNVEVAEESAIPDAAAPPIAVDPADTLAELQLILLRPLDQSAKNGNDQRLPAPSGLLALSVRKAVVDGLATVAQSDLFGSEAVSSENTSAAPDRFSAAALATRVQLWLAGHRSPRASEPTRQSTEIDPAISLVAQEQTIDSQVERPETSDRGLPQRGQEGRVAATQPQSETGGISFSIGALAPGVAIGAPEMQRATGSPGTTPQTLAHGLGTTTEWLDSLTRDIATASSGNQPLRFRVEPQNLGQIDVEVHNDAQKMSISLTASSPSALTALQDAQPRLLADVRTAGLHNAETQIFASLNDRGGSRDHGRGNSYPNQLDRRDTSESDEKTVTPRRRTGRLTDKFA